MNLIKTKTRRALLSCLIVGSIFSITVGTLVGQEHRTTDELSPNVEDNQHQEQIIEIELPDKEIIKGRLCLPESDKTKSIKALIIFIHGTGPGTYLSKREASGKTFNYFDLFAKQFNDQGIAFFSYNKRGVTMGKKPPYFDEVDREKFKRVLPSIEVPDIATIVDFLKTDERLSGAKVALLGWSEGTMIAPMVAAAYPGKIDALLLAGYAHENLFDIIKWQYSGHASMLKLNPVFDKDDDNQISKVEYESDDKQVAKFRKSVMQGTAFDLLDATQDGALDAEDFAIRSKPVYSLLLYNVAKGNDDWIWNNYFRISAAWLQEHFSLEPNKSRLTRLNIPIYVFHGTDDPHVDVQGVYDLEKRINALGKTNVHTFVFKDHEHSLNFSRWYRKGELSEGLVKLFEVASNWANSN